LSFQTKVSAYPRENVKPAWITVGKCSVSLSFAGDIAECETIVIGKSGMKKVEGVLCLDLVKSNGSTKNIAKWNVSDDYGMSTIKTVRTAESGIYQLSFSGKTYMTDGSTESISASTTKIK